MSEKSSVNHFFFFQNLHKFALEALHYNKFHFKVYSKIQLKVMFRNYMLI